MNILMGLRTASARSSMKSIIFLGWIRKGKPADCGETMKNQLLIHRIEKLGVKCRQVDFKDWRKHPWVFVQLLWDLVVHKDETLIMSTSTQNTYPMMQFMKHIGWKQNTVHWVIGGALGYNTKQGIFQPCVIGYMNHTLVESGLMVKQLEECGVKGIKEVPNFKPITYYPQLTQKQKNGFTRFVFLSRIMPEKGCGYILEAARMLNEEHYKNKYSIDFYGKVDESYQDAFLKNVNEMDNINYAGFLNLRKNSGYDTLSSYDIMLFPTYWKGEGLAGIFIDAFISGVPMIVTDWAHNMAFVSEGETGLFVPVHDAVALKEKMCECIEGKYDLNVMAKNCQVHADNYNIDKVVTKDLLKEIGVLD